MIDEDVTRKGRWITVQRGAVKITRAYGTVDAANRAMKRLLFERAARTRFLERRVR